MKKKITTSKRLSFQGLSVVVLLLAAVGILATGFSSWFVINDDTVSTSFDFDIASTILEKDIIGYDGEPRMPNKVSPHGFVDDGVHKNDLFLEVPFLFKFSGGLDEFVINNAFTINISLINSGSFTNFFEYNVPAQNRMEIVYSEGGSLQTYQESANTNQTNSINSTYSINFNTISPVANNWHAVLYYKFDFSSVDFNEFFQQLNLGTMALDLALSAEVES